MGSHDIGRYELEAHERKLELRALLKQAAAGALMVVALLAMVWLFSGCSDSSPTAVPVAIPTDPPPQSTPIVVTPNGDSNQNDQSVVININIGSPTPAPATGGRG